MLLKLNLSPSIPTLSPEMLNTLGNLLDDALDGECTQNWENNHPQEKKENDFNCIFETFLKIIIKKSRKKVKSFDQNFKFTNTVIRWEFYKIEYNWCFNILLYLKIFKIILPDIQSTKINF